MGLRLRVVSQDAVHHKARRSSSCLPYDGNPLGADAVLRALLDANPRSCNAANVLCVLTLSSRLLSCQLRRQRGWDNNDKAKAEGEGKVEEEREEGQGCQCYGTLLTCTILIFNKQFKRVWVCCPCNSCATPRGQSRGMSGHCPPSRCNNGCRGDNYEDEDDDGMR